jgi:AAA domain-containing protein
MPIASSALEIDSYLRVLVVGGPKLGKTSVSICTSPQPVRVILAERDSALRDAKRRGGKFDFERIRDRPYEQMTTYLAQAKEDAKAGKIKTIVIDPLSEFAEKLVTQSFLLNRTSNGEEDGRAAYPHYSKRLMHVLELACTIPAHLIVISHFVEMGGGELPGQAQKQGEGIVPLIPGKIRLRIGGCFDDILWFDVDKQDPSKRVFITGPQGAWGPGCRSLSKFAVLPADFNALIKTFAEDGPPAGKKNGVQVKPTQPRSAAMKR